MNHQLTLRGGGQAKAAGVEFKLIRRRKTSPLEWDDEVKAFSATYPQLNYQLESIADPRESLRDFLQSQFGRALNSNKISSKIDNNLS